MPVPDFQSLMLPALKAFADGEELPLSKVRERVAVAEGLSAEDVRERLPSSRQTVFVNYASWAVIYMERAGLLERIRHGVYRVTNDGERQRYSSSSCCHPVRSRPLQIECISCLTESVSDLCKVEKCRTSGTG